VEHLRDVRGDGRFVYVAPDAEARVRGRERIVERPGDGPPRAGDLAAGGKAAEDVGRDGDRTAREFGGLRGEEGSRRAEFSGTT
jgi:S-adenosylmethionine synthetase